MIDFSPIITVFISTVFYVLIKLLPLLLISFFLIKLIKKVKPKVKGFVGEGLVSFAAKVHLDSRKYHMVNDVTIPTTRGTTQIDHVIVSRYGVFVVETKNMSGWIFGSEDQKTWTQVIYQKKIRFRNPILQNRGHIYALSKLLDVPKECFVNVVCFMGDAKFKTEMPQCVRKHGSYISYIESFSNELFTEEKKKDIIKYIESGRLKPSRETNKNHIKHVRSLDSECQTIHVTSINSACELSPLCPRCDSFMVKRKNRKNGSEFWGCPNYPRCRGTRN
jgi:hypothetical protein